MTDRVRRITVILEQETRVDNAEPIVAALQMVKGVGDVVPQVGDYEAREASRTALLDLKVKIANFLQDLWKSG
jgi:hypothetical protein